MASSSKRGPGGRGNLLHQLGLGTALTPGARLLLVIFGATYLLGLIPPVEHFIVDQLLLRPGAAIGPQPYRLLTAPMIVHGLFPLLFLGLLLWQIGAVLETRIGTRRFLRWVASTLLVSTLAAALIGRLSSVWAVQIVPIEGHPLFPLCLLAFAHYYGSAQMQMWGLGQPVSARGMSYFFVGIGLLADVLTGQWLALAAQLAAVGWTLLLLRQPWRSLRRPPARKLHAIDGGLGAGAGPKSSEPRWLN